MRALSYRLITALGPGALTNVFPRIFDFFFILEFFKIKKDQLHAISLLTARTCEGELSGWERWCSAVTAVTIATQGHRGPVCCHGL
jgi:hypothetical protein